MSNTNFNRPKEISDTTSVFYGIDKGERIDDGCFADTLNMSGNKFPCLSSRSQRANMHFGVSIAVAGEPCDVVDNNGALAVLCRNGRIMCFGQELSAGEQGRNILRFGKKLFVSPSGALVENGHVKFAEAKIGDFFNCVQRDGSDEPIEILSGNKPSSPVGGTYWADRETGGIYRYSSVQEQWVAVAALRCNFKLKAAAGNYGAYEDFSVDDGVKILIPGEEGDISTFVTSVSAADGITLEMDSPFVGDVDAITIKREFPALQFACVHNNRIWGCNANDIVNEIYASKLGDPLNWCYYRGLSTDSYAVSVGEPGEFTGCVSFGDSVLFFKEMCIFSLYGTEPSNFQLVKNDCFGVQKGSEKSVVKINGQIYYKSCHGIMRISEGSLPQCISDALGDDVWHDAVAGTDGNKYYIIMTDVNGNRFMYVYDPVKHIWHKEDVPCEGTFCMVYHKNNLLCVGKRKISEDNYELLFSYISNELTCNEYLLEDDERVAVRNDEGRFFWKCETGVRGLSYVNFKRLKEIDIQLKLGAGSQCDVSVQYDGRGRWNNVGTVTDEGISTLRIKDRLERCETYRLRLSGFGRAVIYGITEVYEDGGNIGF